MLFSNLKNSYNILVRINNADIEMVNVITFLGVLIDHKLTWKQHISMIMYKLVKSIVVINRAKHVLNKDARLTLYYSLILSFYRIYLIAVKFGVIPTELALNLYTYSRRK